MPRMSGKRVRHWILWPKYDPDSLLFFIILLRTIDEYQTTESSVFIVIEYCL